MTASTRPKVIAAMALHAMLAAILPLQTVPSVELINVAIDLIVLAILLVSDGRYPIHLCRRITSVAEEEALIGDGANYDDARWSLANLKAIMVEGDELWIWQAPLGTLFRRAGFIIVHDGQPTPHYVAVRRSPWDAAQFPAVEGYGGDLSG